MERDSGSVTAAFHGCGSALGSIAASGCLALVRSESRRGAERTTAPVARGEARVSRLTSPQRGFQRAGLAGIFCQLAATGRAARELPSVVRLATRPRARVALDRPRGPGGVTVSQPAAPRWR